MNLRSNLRLLSCSLTLSMLLLNFGHVANASEVFYTVSSPSAEAISEAPELQGATVYDFFLTTATDLLLIDVTTVRPANGATFFQSAAADANDIGAPDPSMIPSLPSLEFDTFINTPGDTMNVACSDFEAGIGTAGYGADDPISGDCSSRAVVWFDVEDDGALDMFRFARLTTVGDNFIEFGFTTAERNENQQGPDRFDFEFSISGSGRTLVGATFVPEPNSCILLSLAGVCLLFRTRRRRSR